MPTTQDENARIISICRSHVDVLDLYTMALRLDTEVGQVSENDSVRQTMASLRRMVEKIVQDAYGPESVKT